MWMDDSKKVDSEKNIKALELLVSENHELKAQLEEMRGERLWDNERWAVSRELFGLGILLIKSGLKEPVQRMGWGWMDSVKWVKIWVF